MRLSDKVAIVTGGGSGIGAEISRAFAREGALVVVADLDGEKAVALAAELTQAGHPAIGKACDVSNHNDVQDLTDSVARRFGRIDILVTSAGISKFGPIEDLSVEWWDKVVGVNLNGLFYCCHSVAQIMMKQRSGKIINIASLAGLTGIPNQAPYVASKHGVVGLTKALAIDLGPYAINVNCMCPATTLTPLALETRSQDFIDAEAHRTPLDRMAYPEDHARAAVFLASAESDYLTGVILPVDGGRIVAMRAHD